MRSQQLIIESYQLDENATKAAVEKFLRQAREYKVTEYIPEEARMISNYSDMPRSNTGLTSDQTGRIAIANVDEPIRRQAHVERAEKAINRLGLKQQSLIRLRYLDEDGVMDFDIAEELGYSDRHYRRIKSDAIYRLASMLGLQVLQDRN